MSSTDENSTDTLATVAEFLRNIVPDEGSIDAEKWSSKCVQRIEEAWNTNVSRTQIDIRDGLVLDPDGKTFSQHPQADAEAINGAWGISLPLCKEYCSRSQFGMVTSFNRISQGSANYLLPWLALIAQLPYETGGTGSNIMSACMGLGSPMLMTFSLTMTILNKGWIRKKLKGIRCPNGADWMYKKLKDAVIVAEASQQVPTYLVQKNASLARLILLDKKEYNLWWKEAANNLKLTRREVTLSLVAQLLVAAIAWILTVIGSMKTKVGDTEEALVLSSGSLWIWLFPIILGWILVGTQNKENTIKSALRNANRHLPPGIINGIDVWHETNYFPVDQERSMSHAESQQNMSNRHFRQQINAYRKLWIFDVAGYQRQQGPAFNYARSLTWINFADRLSLAFDAAVTTLERGGQSPPPSKWPDDTQDDYVEISSGCGLAFNTFQRANGLLNGGVHETGGTKPAANEYPMLKEVSVDAQSTFLKHVVCSIIMGIVIQWGTTILAFIIAYQTVVRGLGCRSGSYLVYGILSTAACISLLLSAAWSHITMRKYQSNCRDGATQLYATAAIVTRLLGRVLLVANTVWLLLISTWELIGFFDSCFCTSNELSKKDAGWVLLFKNADALKEDAQAAWSAGIGIGFVLIFCTTLIFYLASRQRHDYSG